MPRPTRDRALIEVLESSDELVRIGAQFAIPATFVAEVTPTDPAKPRCRLEIEIHKGKPVCSQLTVGRTEAGQAVTGSRLRTLPIDDWVRRAADDVAHEVVGGQDVPEVIFEGVRYPLRGGKVDDTHVAYRVAGLTLTSTWRASERATDPRAITDELLQEVADIYREALIRNAPPTNAVANEKHVSRPTAGRWVVRARRAGFLGPAPGPGAAGERQDDA